MTITQASAGIFTNGSNDQFGTSVALASGTLLATAPKQNTDGELHAFNGSGTSWTYLQLVAPSGGSTAFAQSVGLNSAGNTIVVAGTPNGALTDFVFSKTGPNWFPVNAPIVTPVASSFGLPVAVDGTTFVSGGFKAAYVYATSGGAPQVLTPSDFVPDDLNSFGSPLALSGDTIVVGAQPFDSQGQAGHFAYVFVRSGSTWSQQAKLVPSDLLSNSNPSFRFSLATDGASVIFATTNGIYVFTRSGTTWLQTQKIVPPTNSNPSTVALSGNLLVVGNPNFLGNAGSAFVYGRSNGTWILGPTLSTGINADEFGISVAVGQGTVAVGAPDINTNGSVHVYSCSP